jgi:hypothetical protein
VCLGQTIVDIGTQRLQGNLPLDLFLSARDLGSTQTATNDNLDALGIGAHRLLYRLLHSATERDALLQLLSNTPTDQVCIKFGLANLDDVHTNALPGLPFEHTPEPLDLLTTLTDNDTRPGRVNLHQHLVGSGTLDLDARDRGVGKLFIDYIAD